MRMKLVLSVFVVLLVIAATLGATFAYFTDTAEAEPIAFQAGTLEVSIDGLDELGIEQIDGRETAVIDNLNPGDKWGWEFKICNDGSKTFHSALYICWQDTIGRLNEALSDTMREDLESREDYGTEKLSEGENPIHWKLYQESTSTEPIFEGEMSTSTMPMLIEIEDDDGFIIIEPGQCMNFILVAELPTDAGNEYQGSKMDLAVGVLAWQTTNDAPALDEADVECPTF